LGVFVGAVVLLAGAVSCCCQWYVSIAPVHSTFSLLLLLLLLHRALC
jgi:hypothetical protein